MKKVAHVVESFSTGILQLLVEITTALSGRFDFTIIHSVRPETPADFAPRFPPGVEFRPWNVGRELSPKGDLAAFRELRRMFDDIKPDVIHAHSSKAGAIARLAGTATGRPVLYTPHSFSFLRQDVSFAKRNVYQLIEFVLGRLPHLTVASGIAEFREALKVSRHVHIVRNGLLMPEPSGPAVTGAATLRVVNSGGIRPQKNFPLFCRIAARPELAAMSFTWVGGGDIPADTTVPRNVTVTGWVSREEAYRHVREADVFLMTSRWEGLCIAMLEAMGLGKPILSSRYPGSDEAVIEGANGFLCADEAAFARRLLALQADRKLLNELGRCARVTVEREFSPEMFAARWASVYDSPEQYFPLAIRNAYRRKSANGVPTRLPLGQARRET